MLRWLWTTSGLIPPAVRPQATRLWLTSGAGPMVVWMMSLPLPASLLPTLFVPPAVAAFLMLRNGLPPLELCTCVLVKLSLNLMFPMVGIEKSRRVTTSLVELKKGRFSFSGMFRMWYLTTLFMELRLVVVVCSILLKFLGLA